MADPSSDTIETTIPTEAVITAVAAGHTTLHDIADALGVCADDNRLTTAINLAVSNAKLRTWSNRVNVMHFSVVPAGTVDSKVLEFLRAQDVRRLVREGNDVLADLRDVIDRVQYGNTVAHSTTLASLAGRLTGMAAVAANIERVDTLMDDAGTRKDNS